jgi:hypothetical protein
MSLEQTINGREQIEFGLYFLGRAMIRFLIILTLILYLT